MLGREKYKSSATSPPFGGDVDVSDFSFSISRKKMMLLHVLLGIIQDNRACSPTLLKIQ